MNSPRVGMNNLAIGMNNSYNPVVGIVDSAGGNNIGTEINNAGAEMNTTGAERIAKIPFTEYFRLRF